MSRAAQFARRAGSAVQYASRTTGVNFEKILTWGAVAGIAYLAYKAFSFGSGVKSALNETGSKIGLTLYDWVHGENAGIGEKTFLAVFFPDSEFRSVPSLAVNPLTREFKGPHDGRAYRLMRQATKIDHPKTGKPFSNLRAVRV